MSENPAVTPDGYCTNTDPVPGTTGRSTATPSAGSSSKGTAAATRNAAAVAAPA